MLTCGGDLLIRPHKNKLDWQSWLEIGVLKWREIGIRVATKSPPLRAERKPLISETRVPIPVEKGKPQRYDYEYKREGTCNLFLFFQPLGAWRHVKVTERRTAKDWAYCMKDLVDVHFPDAVLISVVQDNLNTHTPAALYETFEPAEARRIISKLDFRYTPKHGSWLNMAECELGVLLGQCLDQRIPNIPTVRRKTTAWEKRRNTAKATVNWRFTTTTARMKLRRLYPS